MSKNRYANVNNIDIKPIVYSNTSNNYLFRKVIFAKKKLEFLKTKYTTRREEGDKKNDSEVILWIRNYDLSNSDRLRGYKGNFARLFIERIEIDENEKIIDSSQIEQKYTFTIGIEKIIVDPRDHPERKYIKRRHPNWGHPVLRDIKRKREYDTLLEARNDLDKLKIQYPEISIPGNDLMYIMIYEKDDDYVIQNTPIKKYVLEIKEIGDKYKIDAKLNNVKSKFNRPHVLIFPFTN